MKPVIAIDGVQLRGDAGPCDGVGCQLRAAFRIDVTVAQVHFVGYACVVHNDEVRDVLRRWAQAVSP